MSVLEASTLTAFFLLISHILISMEVPKGVKSRSYEKLTASVPPKDSSSRHICIGVSVYLQNQKSGKN